MNCNGDCELERDGVKAVMVYSMVLSRHSPGNLTIHDALDETAAESLQNTDQMYLSYRLHS
jgi:hypothetical protein